MDGAIGSDDWKQVFALLDTALELKPDALAGWFDSFDESQRRLRPAIEKLLADRTTIATSGFLHMPAQARSRDTGPGSPDASETRVGAYRLLREIGRGGTATVWLAERADGLLTRKVALKLPDVSWHGPALAERMARERNILSSLTHPSIARLYDAGVEANGRPYLAMEYIDGQPIDVYARSHDLSVRARVALLAEVARAVGYAHSQLVVHRDLKPSNILVDAHGRVHLVDFGIARLIDPSFGAIPGNADHTLAIGRALTPDYASPEQIRGDAIGTASDLYSLGIVAFELLAGVRPYRLDPTVGAVALAEAVARVDIPRASGLAADRRVGQQLQGDLDAVLERMLAKRIEDRYPTVDALADDLDRYRADQPVQARSASRIELARRWIRRHKVETGIGCAITLALADGAYAQVVVALALGAGAVLALWQRNRAVEQAELARAAARRGEEVKNFIASIFTHAVPRAGQSGGVAATDLLKAAARRIETDLAGQPAVAAELAALVGASFNELGDVRAGLDWLPKAVELCTREFGSMHPLTLSSRRRWVEAANTVGELSVSDALLPALLMDLRTVQPAQFELLVQTLQSQAFVHTKYGREHEALASLHEAVDIAVRHAGEASVTALSARASMANTLGHFGRFAEELDAITPAMAPAYAAYGADRPNLILTAIERTHADALTDNQRPREASAILRQVVADQTALDGGETHRVRVAVSMLAHASLNRGRFDEAVALFARSAAIHERLTGGANAEGLQGLTALALSEALRGEGESALLHLERAMGCVSSELGSAYRDKFGIARALAAVAIGRDAAALASADALLEHETRLPATIRVRAHRVRVIAMRRMGLLQEARVAASTLLASIDPQCLALEHGLLCVEAARVHRALGDVEAARAQWRQALAVWDEGQVDGPELRDPLREEFASLSPTG